MHDSKRVQTFQAESVTSFFFNSKRIVSSGAAYLLRMLNPDGRSTSSNSFSISTAAIVNNLCNLPT
jgi:hypothetical protein